MARWRLPKEVRMSRLPATLSHMVTSTSASSTSGRRRLKRIGVIAAGFCIVSWPAAAQQLCGARNAILQSLARNYQESPAAMGVSNGGAVIEVFTARNGKTWTILLTRPDGKSCIVAAGESWTAVPQDSSSSDDTI